MFLHQLKLFLHLLWLYICLDLLLLCCYSPKMLNNILINYLFCSFASFLIFWLTTFIDRPDFSNDLTILILLIISWFEIFNVVVCEATSKGRRDPNIFLWRATSVANTAAVNHNGIKTLLARFLLKTSRFLIMVLKIYRKLRLIVLFDATVFSIILY